MKEIIVNGLTFSFSASDQDEVTEQDPTKNVEEAPQDNFVNSFTTVFGENMVNLTGNAFGDYKRRLGQKNQCLKPGCLRAFLEPKDLEIHTKTVHKYKESFHNFTSAAMKTFKCPLPECSDKIFRSKYPLRDHFKNVHEKKLEMLKCALCKYKTVSNDWLVRHIEANHTRVVKD